ncbi:MAG: cation-translocating P-type ATPase [Pirellulales bacterium]
MNQPVSDLESTPAVTATCDYCGLPVAGPPHSSTPDDDAPVYCCFGCSFAAAIAGSGSESGHARGLLIRLGIALFFTMNVMMFALTLWTEDVYGGSQFLDHHRAAVLHEVFRYVCLLSTLPVIYLLGVPLAENVLNQPRMLARSTDLLLLLGVLAAFVYSAWSVFQGTGHIYFEVCCVVLLTVTLGRWFEATGKLKTTAALRSLEALVPDQVRLWRDGREEIVPTQSLAVGQDVVVLAGERVPIDGVIVEGNAAVDQQLITGESEPAGMAAGAKVYAGSLNLDGRLRVRVEAAPGHTAIDEIVAIVTAAATTRERYGRLADRVSSIFLPLVIVAALATAGYWIAWGMPSLGILRGLAVVVIACPCALALATPMAIWSCFGRAAQAGIIIRQADVLDRLGSVSVVCVDKTGTLTTGHVSLRQWITTREIANTDSAATAQSVRRWARALARNSNHPVCQAICADPGSADSPQSQRSDDQVELESIHAVAGRGLLGRWPADGSESAGTVGLLGNLAWMEQHQQSIPDDLRAAIAHTREEGRSLALIAAGGMVLGLLVLDEQIRPEADRMLDFFHHRGLQIQLLTGDHQQRADRLAAQLGIQAIGELLPSDKADRIRDWKQAGQCVLMIGDGVNDAPALAVADVSLAMGCGAEISRHTADVCLLSNDLSQLEFLFQLAGDTIATVRWNLVWSLMYNTLAIPLAMVGWVNPIVAAIAMVVSSLMVVGNSLSLARESGIRPPQNSFDDLDLYDEADGFSWSNDRRRSNRLDDDGEPGPECRQNEPSVVS